MANNDTTTLPPPRLSFRDKLQARLAALNNNNNTACLCVGLDPHTAKNADEAFTFCKSIVDATAHIAVCYKPNAAFFECHGPDGIAALQRLCRDVISSTTQCPILLDVKRGDIGSTATAYAKACYDVLGADAVTLSPFMGWDSIAPFVTGPYADRGAFVLCKTSNPGSNDILTLPLLTTGTVYQQVATLVSTTWKAQCPPTALLGLVVGATDPVALAAVRAVTSDTWILAPGVGAQGATVADTIQACGSGQNLMVPVSRGISQAAEGPKAAAEALAAELATAESETSGRTPTTDASTTARLPQHQRDFLAFSLEQGVLKFGSFILKSGRTSPYFFNAGLFASGQALYRLGKAYAATIMQSTELVSPTDGVQFDVIFGPAYKGISLGAVVSSVLYSDFGVDVGFGYNRKEAKDHGEGGTLVGSALSHQRVVILDDVITAGTAVRQVVELLHTAEAKPAGVVIALDRDEIRSPEDRISAVQAVARDLGISVFSIVGLKELQMFLEQSSDYDANTLESVIRYRKEYGAS